MRAQERRLHRAIGLIAGLTLLLVAPASSLAAQGGMIRGRVADSTGAPLPNASLTLDGTNARATSGAQGEFALRGVPAGTFTLRVRLLGYVPQTTPVTVDAGATVTRDFTLASKPIRLSAIDVVVGSRARHTAAEELAVPVDIFPAEVFAQQGTTETAQILAQVAPSVNFPRQSIADATDIVRPFTMRGLSPDHTLVLVNGKRRHRMALVHVFGAALGAGSSGVDMNALPDNAIDRIDVLRDGAAAQYGSDAIAGVVNLVLKEGAFTPTLNSSWGRHMTADFPDDGTTYTVGGGWGLLLGPGSLALFATFRQRGTTNRACPDNT
ncbi:MAG: TonB-dependent receptor, partial [Gemmatimonadales bacterium]